MKKLLLTSHGFSDEPVRQAFLKLLPKPSQELTAAIITTASVEWKEKNKYAVSTKQYFEELGFKKVSFIDIEFNDPNLLKNFDVIYLNGGNTFYLLHHLKKSGADKVLKEIADKTIIVGTSAGAVVLGPDIKIAARFDDERNTIGLKNFSALDLTDVIIIPHYRKELENDLKNFEKENDCHVTRLKDGQAIVIIGNAVEFI
ncbi:MAG: hypothetical protein A2744_00245 [Candidatus Buchananbacteria bacterium RIFCSPHIGHO2_01_FULL_44_11]|uniref:Peptidase S51 n=1 Tax=Candidatus Buchananbacteria bacterium RIFCSPHIGHO2_01_FULL_44_11 TaxID=1797535 RepID=A0A1G1Y0E1_9BACT|nr:MAG: hypothetical protein A2744_00245 [Candidatus Buchananbacteria bacterium RIFCSPHIGHO2_01_FULL_44_11]